MSVTLGRSTGAKTWVNPPKLTRGSSPAEPETAEALGIRPQATVLGVLGLDGELLQARIQRWWWPGLRWPELTTASSSTAAGVQVCTGLQLRCMGGGTDGCYGLLGVHSVQ